MIIAIVAAAILGSRNAVDLAPTALPSMFLLISAMLGIHRFSGSMDFAAAAGQSAPPGIGDPRPPFGEEA